MMSLSRLSSKSRIASLVRPARRLSRTRISPAIFAPWWDIVPTIACRNHNCAAKSVLMDSFIKRRRSTSLRFVAAVPDMMASWTASTYREITFVGLVFDAGWGNSPERMPVAAPIISAARLNATTYLFILDSIVFILLFLLNDPKLSVDRHRDVPFRVLTSSGRTSDGGDFYKHAAAGA